MSSSQVQRHSLTGSDSHEIINHALATLKPNFPICIPLYRRLQFGRFFDATSLLTNISPGSPAPQDSPWLFAFVDRSCRPETEVWFHGSWESNTNSLSSHEEKAIDELVRNLVSAMKDLGVPTSIHQDLLNAKAEELKIEKDHGGFSRDDYGGHMVDSNIMLWGATHEKTVTTLQRLGLLNMRFKTGLVPNFTFIWDVDSLPTPKELPDELRWGELKPEHFSIVRSRTQIPRQDRTLAVLPNIGIFSKNTMQPIAWAFVGLDASLTTLHVEPEWRGRGLAKAVTTKLFKEKMGSFWEEGMKRLAYGFVIVGNKESEGMCRSLGGKSDWLAYWLRVDLSRL